MSCHLHYPLSLYGHCQGHKLCMWGHKAPKFLMYMDSHGIVEGMNLLWHLCNMHESMIGDVLPIE